MQRRVPDYAVQFTDFNEASTIGAFGFFLAQFIFIFNMLACCYGWFGRQRNVSDRVWEGARGLEWTVPSPAPYHTFEIGRAHVCTPVTNAHLVCRLLLAKNNKTDHN